MFPSFWSIFDEVVSTNLKIGALSVIYLINFKFSDFICKQFELKLRLVEIWK